MIRPYVALVGRPNTGKSTLFNRIAGRRISIVENTPGVTRDRIVTQCEWLGNSFYLIDTGGIEPYSDDIILSKMREQAYLAMDMAEAIVFVTDGREGVTAADKEIAALLMRCQSKVVLAVNKIEERSQMEDTYEFYELGLGEPFAISAEHGVGIGDLLDEVVAKFPGELMGIEAEESLKIAVVGRPNAGKSTLVNVLLGEDRVIVSEVAGTTRDAIDTPFRYENEQYTLIDTAGIRKNAKQGDAIEYYSMLRALRAIERSDLCVLIIDASCGVTDQDTRIASAIAEAYKAMVVVINKWDLIEKQTNTMAEMEQDIRGKLHFVDYAPIIFMSAGKNQRVGKLMPKIQEVFKQYSRRVPTGLLNDAVGDAAMMNQPPIRKGRSLKLFYTSQPAVSPPTFVIFVNDEKLVTDSYAKYLEGRLRRAFGFEGTPLKIIYRSKKTDKQ
ncbi:MAG: ribosome biogenesis GTPase Der [Eubacteriaceae bacterium]|nr:ribosome biogenesis GTPase Der [Eubacteriaceae bacterium]